ncbi:DUF6115 domain-containing protein [Ornithinibacillus salinisoli]|uniref:DUF6115 domain-containing protein n=1 Tax=Ornithinibacillus salinisoli TaxID=1848459 RepID=A0ABW4W1J4_9BACI
MTSFLLIISFLLHIITLSGVYFLLKQVQSLKDNNHTDLPELLETYLEEIKTENERLQHEISTSSPIKSVSQKVEELSDHEKINVVETDDFEQNSEYTPENMETMNDEVQASLQARILQLHQKGYSNEKIARNLNCGKTEVELTIKLYG